MIRIGHGFDIHRVAPNRSLILGGVQIPWHAGLLGHSGDGRLGVTLVDDQGHRRVQDQVPLGRQILGAAGHVSLLVGAGHGTPRWPSGCRW